MDQEQERYQGIAIAISTAIAKEAKSNFSAAEWAQNIPAYLLLRDDDEITIYFNQLDEAQKDWLHKRLTEGGHSVTAGTLAGLRQAEKDPANAEIKGLKMLAQALGQYLLRDMIDGWIYTIGGQDEQMPWLVNNIYYQEGSNAPPNVVVQIVANTPLMSMEDINRPTTRFVYFFGDDLRHKRVADILATKGYVKETQTLKDAYLKATVKFSDYLVKLNEQFVAEGEGLEVDYERGRRSAERIVFDGPNKVINDEGVMRRKFFAQLDSPLWANIGKIYSEIPIHPKIFCFNLETHTNMWIHVDRLTEYVYNPALREKLILPEEHRDLVDILTQDMDVLMEDIIAGKSGGTTILCKGAPGLGKTLTAEVYSEVVGRPLYRVHSGQLGVDSAAVELTLDKILKRAQRWGAVMLIDEADVYIRQRSNDIDHNAVVASFLRTLEYFHGLLFLTTNRVDDVDDAIASRCIATIVFDPPSPDDAKRIWKVLADQFEFKLTDKLINDLGKEFDGISGRDIKELLKLTAKWCRRKQVKPSVKVFKSCAQFRGL
ncbi:ATP-binding protein [Oxalobacter vibrioformis]|uniref:ATP-binding protein n=1 Tax=Oxalobacter vibrioformis TaxID=933080 RepID=A0A9E9LXF2_9BURK|nr:ATP-binding protein [Oxalobacter vibrioformis]WAW09370.1 ATP-binding protein [Oxalobacter vibrioformis]